ncbi:MAG: 1-deoxy-D-xylulose-5-phosphate synthase [Candidatus Thiodiazotropha sp. (ex Lucinoma borealis)]|nr:1-deoxy-D-xylulose-5-phosphate synthase [Candidatus Thiodiazotropha sp. (ex Lucinoma borealis)]
MWIENKSDGDGLSGPARIGRVSFSNTGKTVKYKGREFQSLKGVGFKANYFETETGDKYWISGRRKDGMDALYNTEVEIDEDVVEEYWMKIRGLPKNVGIFSFRAQGKY